MTLSERSIRVKELIHEQVDMGTFGLVELELKEFDKTINELRETLETFCVGFEWNMENKKEILDKADYEFYDRVKEILG